MAPCSAKKPKAIIVSSNDDELNLIHSPDNPSSEEEEELEVELVEAEAPVTLPATAKNGSMLTRRR
jgi:hypothetical protein